MLELITGEALFNGMGGHYQELPILIRIVLAGAMVCAVALLVLTMVSLISYVTGGAPFIATPKHLTRKIVSIAEIQPGERVYDLGCGDGRFLIEARRAYQADAVGVEISPLVFILARLTCWIHGAKVSIHLKNIAHIDFSDADVIFCYLVPETLAMIAERFNSLRPGCRVVSRRFELPGLEPTRVVSLRRGRGTEPIYIYRKY